MSFERAAGHYADAISMYTQAIESDPLSVAVYTNRSLCHIKMETYGLAIADATTATELDPKCVKAYYRLGSAYMGLGKYKEARTNYKKACQLKPTDKDAALRLKECDRQVKREAFEKVNDTRQHQQNTRRGCTVAGLAARRHASALASVHCSEQSGDGAGRGMDRVGQCTQGMDPAVQLLQPEDGSCCARGTALG